MQATTLTALQELAAVAGGAGVARGIRTGLLGIGGGIVIVPALYFALTLTGMDPALTMKVAVGTSLAAIVFTALVLGRGPHRRGGIVSGSALIGVATVALIDTADMILQKGHPKPKGFPPSVWAAFGILTGTIGAMRGIGRGTIGVPFLNFLGYDIFAPGGLRPAYAIPRRALRLAFGGFLLLTALRMVDDLAGS